MADAVEPRAANQELSKYSALSHNVRVVVKPVFSPERSEPHRRQWFFLYTVTIVNEGRTTLQLVSRHWTITDAYGQTEEVRGPGVVGEQPILRPGQSFEYTSGCPLRTPFGGMVGEYQMVDPDGATLEISIPAFVLRDPASMQ